MQKRTGIAAASVGLAALAVAAVALLVWPGHLLGGAAAAVPVAAATLPGDLVIGPGSPVPTGAASATTTLVEGSAAQQRAELTPIAASVLATGGAMFPPGSTVNLDAGSWEQTGTYANATATLDEPGGKSSRIEIGYALVSGSWLVVFEGPLS